MGAPFGVSPEVTLPAGETGDKEAPAACGNDLDIDGSLTLTAEKHREVRQILRKAGLGNFPEGRDRVARAVQFDIPKEYQPGEAYNPDRFEDPQGPGSGLGIENRKYGLAPSMALSVNIAVRFNRPHLVGASSFCLRYFFQSRGVQAVRDVDEVQETYGARPTVKVLLMSAVWANLSRE